MNMFDRLSKDERVMMCNCIEAYASYDGDNMPMKASLEHVMRFWDANKVDLFRVFGGELILTRKVNIAKPIAYLEEEMSCMVQGAGYNFYSAFSDWARSCSTDIRYDVLELMYCNILATNVWPGVTLSIPTPDGHKIVINKGAKVSKMLGKIAKAFNIDGYEAFRIAHSQCLNQKKLVGELCVSIHPLDYMTMSDNECDWSSCMSWSDKGDYRQGTVEMMNSPYIVVAYLKSDTDMCMPGGYQWNSKKWRQLFIVTPHIITGIRQYPYVSDELNGTVLQWLRELVVHNTTWGPFEETTTVVRNNADTVVASMDRTINLNFFTHFMYNDFYATHPSFLATTIPDFYELCFSGESECMICGEDMSGYDNYDTTTSSLTCDNCEHVVYCAECGDRIGEGDAVEVDGYYYCSCCYENYFKECHLCENTHHENFTRAVYLCVDGEVTNYHIWVCEDCFNSEAFREKFGQYNSVLFNRWETRTVVNVENMTEDTLDLFDIWYNDDYQAYKKHCKPEVQTQSENLIF